MIGLEQLMEAIRHVAATEPDHVYQKDDTHPSCSYLPNALNSCGCIVGEALALLGVPRELLRRMDDLEVGELGSQWGSPYVHELLKDRVTTQALNSSWVRMVQRRQDERQSWAEAVRAADVRVGGRP